MLRPDMALLRLVSLLALALGTLSQARADERAVPLRDRIDLGAYVPGIPYYERSDRALEQLERKLGTKFEIVSGFVDWDYVFGGPRDRALARGGRVLLYSWEPHCVSERECIHFADVASGRHDAYFARIAESMRSFPSTIYVRPWGEMNADWSPWQPGSGRPRAGSPEQFVAAWRHVREYFRARGINNLKFVFNPDATSDASATPIPTIWPGADYVDVLGIDGYNWGAGKPGGPGQWEEFEAIFTPMYEVLTALHPSAPVWICEFGSKEPAKDDGSPARPAPRDARHRKGAWYEAAFESTAFARVTALVHFNVHKERDFRFESSRDSLRAVQRQLKLRALHSTRTSRSTGMPATISSKHASTASAERPSMVNFVR